MLLKLLSLYWHYYTCFSTTLPWSGENVCSRTIFSHTFINSDWYTIILLSLYWRYCSDYYHIIPLPLYWRYYTSVSTILLWSGENVWSRTIFSHTFINSDWYTIILLSLYWLYWRYYTSFSTILLWSGENVRSKTIFSHTFMKSDWYTIILLIDTIIPVLVRDCLEVAKTCALGQSAWCGWTGLFA